VRIHGRRESHRFKRNYVGYSADQGERDEEKKDLVGEGGFCRKELIGK